MRMILPRATLPVVRFLVVASALLAACGTPGGMHGGTAAHRKTDGAIAGLARDGDSAEPLGAADIRIEPPNAPKATGVSGRDGMYLIDHVAPGVYKVIGVYAGQTITTTNVRVDAGEATYVDVSFTPSRPDPFTIDYSDPKLSEITKYRTKDNRTLIEGTVSDSGTRVRIAGAVVTAFGPTGAPTDETLQTVSGDDGRFRFDNVTPGVYVVSAYYSVGGRAEIEVRRSDIHIEVGDDINVPLFIETTKQ
jgi:hypothetical protein